MSSRAAFGQAKALLRFTSRASNPDWYRDALELDFQWHMVVLGGSRVSSVLLVRTAGEAVWLPGPAVNLTVPPTREQVDAMVEEVLATPDFRKARSLGVVLHLGDEFATTEILADVRSASSLEQLREEVLTSPSTVLGDPSLSNDTTATRLMPYAGAQRPPLASTVTLSRTHEPFVELLRVAGEARNFPIQVSAVSAPMVFLAILPAFLQFQEGRPHFVLLHYPKFSCLAVFNPEANLVQLRSLPHRGRPFPGNLGDAVNTALDSLDLHEPVITILPMGEVDPSPLLTQLHATLNEPDQADVHILRPAVDAVAPGVAGMRAEMLVCVPQFSSAEVSLGFKQLYGDRWATQNFLPVTPDVQALYPDANDMKLLRVSRLAIAALAVLLLLIAGLAVVSMVRTMNDPSWNHDVAATAVMQARLQKAQGDVEEYEHWDNLLQERSKGWLAMELLARLFPENAGVKVTGFKQNTKLDAVIKNKRVGFNREWLVSGLAGNDSLTLLNAINGREGLGAVFKKLHEATGNESFNMEVPGRNLVVSMERSRNSDYVKAPGGGGAAGDKRNYPVMFELKIVQTFGAEDPMAISTKALSAK